MTSATDELCKLLDERGVKYDESTQGNTTLFRFDYCDSCDDYLHTITITGACISAYSEYLTPEQAIAATLGNHERTCHDANTRFNAWTCSECKSTQLLMFDDYGEPTLSVDGVASVPNYCPNCGAKVVER